MVGCGPPLVSDGGDSGATHADVVVSADRFANDIAPTTDVPTVDDAVGPVDSGRADGGSRYGSPMQVGTLPAQGLPEVSGIVASRRQPGVFWVENDSGNTPDIFAINAMGTTIATIRLTGATNIDWEDISIDRRMGIDEIYVADTGDNIARESNGAMGRPLVRIYRLPEPVAMAGDAMVTPERFEFTYPMRPYDCEALFVHHGTGDVYFVTKEVSPAEVFVARAPLNAAVTTTLTHVGTIDFSIATAADMSTDGARIVVRGYGEIHVFPVLGGGDVAATFAGPFINAIPAAAAEAIAFEYNGYGMYTVPEGVAARLFYIPSI